ncbi:DUF2332 family protein [Brevundimonas sp.]|uniref:DUF2332 domain-containing protein n=1 Tax=Brevundimonas sp. TaxID=1871086 RepID=UPI0025D59CA8|nr:DUF2332 family protein [Brevundimonas sp.]
MTEAAVRSAFHEQARICAGLGSPFTATVCELVAERLGRSTAVGRRVLDWPGDPRPNADALPLRFAGALHARARRSRPASVAEAWPPARTPADEVLWRAIETALNETGDFILAWLDSPPQTNEVGRSGPLAAGLLVLADRFGLPFDLYELGCSAGLNLNLDRYALDLGGVTAGDATSAVRLTPDWRGPPPPRAEIVVASRRGVDLNPLDATRPETAERLLAYVWADQRDRLARLEAALEIARAHPPPVEAADGADWLERRLSPDPAPGVCRVVMHTIALQYFPSAGRSRVVAHLARAGERATPEAPLAWLSYEAAEAPDADGRRWAELSLTVWPGGERRVLARGHPHGFALEWAG